MRGKIGVLVACGSLLLLGFSSVTAVRNWMGERALADARKEQKRGNINGAREGYAQALSLGKDEGALALARMALLRRDLESVETYAEQAMVIDPTNGYVHLLLAHAAAVGEDAVDESAAERILVECGKAVWLEPTNGYFWKTCADLNLRFSAGSERHRGEALHGYRKALRFSTSSALDILRAPAEIFPDPEFLPETVVAGDMAAMTAAAALLLETGRWEESRAAWRRMEGKSSSPEGFSVAAGRALAAKGRHGEALEEYERALERAPDDDRAWFGMGRSAEKSGDRTRAAESYRRAVQLQGDSVRYRKALARMTGDQ
jgi:tetratricopeptide (TPR) repeat protein